MTAKEFLSQGLVIHRKIESDLMQILQLHALATKCTTVLTGMPRGGLTEGSSSMENAVCNIQLICADIEMDTIKLRAVLDMIRSVINKVDDDNWQLVLEYKYLSFMSFPEIMKQMKKGRTTILEWYRNGMRAVDVLLMQENLNNRL